MTDLPTTTTEIIFQDAKWVNGTWDLKQFEICINVLRFSDSYWLDPLKLESLFQSLMFCNLYCSVICINVLFQSDNV